MGRVSIRLAVGVTAGVALVAAAFTVQRLLTPSTPERVAESFFRAGYRRDHRSAWELVSTQDQQTRSRDAYLAANPSPTRQQAALYRSLEALGSFEVLAIASTHPGQAVLTAEVRFPNPGQPELQALLEAGADPDSQTSALQQDLEALQASGRLGYFQGEVSFNLIQERSRWRVIQHWGTAIRVQLEAFVDPELPWEFYPLAGEVFAQPGELVSASYVAINTSSETVTGKAVHEVGPAEAAAYFQTVQCFCFTEQTLAPGEQREMQLLFRIDFAVPPDLELFRNRYTFYSLEGFPGSG